MFDRFRLPPRLVDWSIFAVLGLELATGLVSLVGGRPAEWLVFVVHSIGGLLLCVLVFWKLRRVRKRVTHAAAWDRTTPVSILLAAITLATLG